MSIPLQKGILYHCDIKDVMNYTSERFVYWSCEEYEDDGKMFITECDPAEAMFWGVYCGEPGDHKWVADCDAESTAKTYVKLLTDTIKILRHAYHAS